MNLDIIGAGLPRTGTTSLKEALERLTGGSCYHMVEVFPRLETHLPLWQQVVDGDQSVFEEIFDGFTAAVDWPASIFWPELLEANPDALVILTRRADPETWWRSVDRTVWHGMRQPSGLDAWDEFVTALRGRFFEPLDDPAGAMAAYSAWSDDVRAAVPADQLLELEPSDGWEPLCAALGVPVPADDYPHANTTREFREMSGWE